jgi:hypothetical protein
MPESRRQRKTAVTIQRSDAVDGKVAKKMMTVILDSVRWRPLKLRCLDEGKTAQTILDATLDAYIEGRKGAKGR